MTCDAVPDFGPLAGYGLLVVVGLMFLATVVALWFRRTGTVGIGARVYVPLGLVAVLAGFLVSPPHVAPEKCVAADNSLTMTQSAAPMVVGPGFIPAAIAGQVTYDGVDETFITSIEVSLSSVTPAKDAGPGTCNITDYLVLNNSMAVGSMLHPGDSASFAGASLGFNDKPSNQDACEGATVHLRYSVTSQ
ncbi:hypothetical protein [Arthrobacter sp. 260]|uniref:hypothetical protein n=1 Tax=Arthrobacter sp. 260 TaxID=2735314 RepID=UPI001492CBD5|nr:hypothetical protein [Arthrobacter sp. 260]NOJ59856.1 hypothetical protein [Arthrobacter sp. 260]